MLGLCRGNLKPEANFLGMEWRREGVLSGGLWWLIVKNTSADDIRRATTQGFCLMHDTNFKLPAARKGRSMTGMKVSAGSRWIWSQQFQEGPTCAPLCRPAGVPGTFFTSPDPGGSLCQDSHLYQPLSVSAKAFIELVRKRCCWLPGIIVSDLVHSWNNYLLRIFLQLFLHFSCFERYFSFCCYLPWVSWGSGLEIPWEKW